MDPDEAAIVTTQGVTSEVLVDGDPMGHVTLADFDEGVTNDQLENEVDRQGINILLQSSPGSFHWWNLSVKSANDIALGLLRTHCDPKHIQIGYRRRDVIGRPYWTLRVRPKSHANSQQPDGEGEYKDAPELVKCWVNRPIEIKQSRPHFELAVGLFGIEPIPGIDEDSPIWFGDSLSVDSYPTITDELKSEL